ncbi:hypothetical protein [Mycobacterium sp. AZCC_0083]|uniref:hypothetical protein n=1 Tax=Mycobacterium sp. AZCC_0083 TaxID=2735882 RepID=UPI001614BDD5|nr:hypothetical protein [Mycobacterium sp. AZCC_0083]MBB5167130.1 hypothetical protein [Mycobacterium sp. AZCC_0083]
MKLELNSGTELYNVVMQHLWGRPFTVGNSKWQQDDTWPEVIATVEVDGVQQQFRLIALHNIAYHSEGSTIETEWYPVRQWPYGRGVPQ